MPCNSVAIAVSKIEATDLLRFLHATLEAADEQTRSALMQVLDGQFQAAGLESPHIWHSYGQLYISVMGVVHQLNADGLTSQGQRSADALRVGGDRVKAALEAFALILSGEITREAMRADGFKITNDQTTRDGFRIISWEKEVME